MLSLSCEMSEVHSAFTHLPSDIDWEATIERALELLDTYPPHYVIRKSKLSFPERYKYFIIPCLQFFGTCNTFVLWKYSTMIYIYLLTLIMSYLRWFIFSF